MHDRADQDKLSLTRDEFLAEMLGVQRSTVSTVGRTLQEAGLIRQSRGGITVIDRAGLEETACDMLRPDPPDLPASAARHVSLTGLIPGGSARSGSAFRSLKPAHLADELPFLVRHRLHREAGIVDEDHVLEPRLLLDVFQGHGLRQRFDRLDVDHAELAGLVRVVRGSIP